MFWGGEKSMKEILKLGAILFIITAVCSGLLGLVNSITQPIIAQKKEATKQEAMKVLIPEAETFVMINEIEEEGIEELYVAQKGKEYLGSVAKVAPEGYGGAIEILVGVDINQAVTGIQILTHTETPGLGANVNNDGFRMQFVGKKAPLQVVKGSASSEEISAITGATITSRAVTEGVNQAVQYINTHQEVLMGEVK